jgi:hypothetical protein
MGGVPRRCSDWVLVHPVLWAAGAGVVLVLLGCALDLAPIEVTAAGAAIGVLNIVHAKKRGYCPLPAKPSCRRESRPSRASGTATKDPQLEMLR